MEFKILQKLKNALLLLGLSASASMVQGQVYTFTNAGATGVNGPTQAQVTTAYASTTLATGVTVTGGIQSWTVPVSGLYKIEAYGANGYGVYGGKGAYMSGEFNLAANDVLKVIVGQMGQCCSGAGTNQYGGGGGSFVVAAANTPLVIAGGGGGGSTFYSSVNLATSHNTAADASITTSGKTAVGSTVGAGGTAGSGGGAGGTGGGGGGFSTDGLPAGTGGFAFVNGGVGGGTTSPTGLGGFGGGGGITGQNNMRAGGGGGYSGGGGAGSSTTVVQIGGGGGSYNSGTNQVNTPALGTGHGTVIITKLGPLAIDLKDISAGNIGGKNRIDWSTAKEEGGDRFELERSTDGENFIGLAGIHAKGSANSYSYLDELPFSGDNYYRLKLVQASGRTSYSKIISATVSQATAFSLAAYPNPVGDVLTVHANGATGADGTLLITDMSGKILRTVSATGAITQIDMAGVAPGIYFIKYSDSKQSQTIKVHKQ